MKNNIIFKFIVLLIFLFIAFSIIIHPKEVLDSSIEALNICFNIVFPSLLPFFIIIEILIELGIANFLGVLLKPFMKLCFNLPGESAFAFVMSISSGYPVGAKTVADLRRKKLSSKIEAQRMLSFCSTSGPLFIIGTVSIGFLKNSKVAPVLLISHYLSAISCGLIMRFYKAGDKPREYKQIENPFLTLLKHMKRIEKPIGKIIADSIKNSINLILIINGYIVFFSVLAKILIITNILYIPISLLSKLVHIYPVSISNLSVFIIGALEVTNGIKECVSLNIPLVTQVILISFFIGFGGISVNAQVSGLIQNTDLSFPIYFFIKIIQGSFAAFYSYILLKLYNYNSVFKTYSFKYNYNSLTKISVIKSSLLNLANALIIIIIFSLIAYIFNLNTQKKN